MQLSLVVFTLKSVFSGICWHDARNFESVISLAGQVEELRPIGPAWTRLDGLESVDLEKKVNDFLDVLRKDNDEVLHLAEELLKKAQAAKILELTKNLSKEFGIVQSSSKFDDRRRHPDSPTDDLVINYLEALHVGPEGLLYIPSLSAVEASAGPFSRPPRVVTNPLADSNHTVEQIWGRYNSPPGSFPNARVLKLEPETHEDLIERLGGLAKAYADALNKNVQLIPLAVIDDSFTPNPSRPVAKLYKDFAVALVEVVPSSFLQEPLVFGNLKALVALGIRIDNRLISIPY
ncbi:hypothetical protein DdX_12263 [Ditylenchus destructor]|uniref:Uncharacterized protein n=1 Tax=Ditylenchus destructor TaxID=166010 RepID=A0AAD4MWP2_9BILA|nr:hypothetical protein DdX_12263 [Ditylenchus destructor]